MLFRKMIRDLRSNKAQFISIFILVIIGLLVFTGINSLGIGMKQSVSKYYDQTNLADAMFTGTSFSDEQIEELSRQEGVDGVVGRYQVNCTLNNNSDIVLQMNYIADDTLSSFYLDEGIDFNINSKDVWIDAEFAKDNSIVVGDSITYNMSGKSITQKVAGLIMHPEYVYCVKDDKQAIPDHKNYGYGFCSKNVLHDVRCNQILIDTDLDKEELEDCISRTSLKQTGVLVTQDDFQSVAMFNNEINQMKEMQVVFPLAFLVIAFLTIITTMTRITSNQRPQIGILKALGFSNRKIVFHYISYGLLISLVGGVLGTIIGLFVMVPVMFEMEKSMYTMPEWFVNPVWYTYVVLFGSVVICVLCSYAVARKELVGTAASILRPRVSDKQNHTVLDRLSWWKRRKFDTQWNMRDCFNNKLRSFITIFGVMGAVMLIECGLGMSDTMKGMVDYSYERINTYDRKVELSTSIDSNDIEAIRNNKNTQLIMESPIEIFKKDDNNKIVSSNMTVFEEGDYLHCLDNNSKQKNYQTDGITITNRMAEKLNLKEDDTVVFRVYGTDQWVEGKVTDIVRNPIGQGIFIPYSVYKNISEVYMPNYLLIDNSKLPIQEGDYASIQTKESLKNGITDMLSMMNSIIVILIGAAVILGSVVLYNLGVLSFYERVRELATLKVLGFQYKRLQRLLMMQNVILSVIGCLIGIPAGKLMLKILMNTMGDSFDMPGLISIKSYLFAVAGTFALSIVVTRFLSSKLKTIDMVSALKSVE